MSKHSKIIVGDKVAGDRILGDKVCGDKVGGRARSVTIGGRHADGVTVDGHGQCSQCGWQNSSSKPILCDGRCPAFRLGQRS